MKLDDPVLTFPNEAQTPNDHWTLRNAVEGVQIFGGIGSGKTSGSGATLAKKFLSLGFGGLVLTVKPDEKDIWVEYCNTTNRLDDLCIIEEGGAFQFDFLSYEFNRSGLGAGLTDNLVNVLKTVIKASNSHQQGTNEEFWENALDMLLFNTIDLCVLAFDELNILELYKVVQSLPKKRSLNTIQSETSDYFSEAVYRAKIKMGLKAEAKKRAFLNDHPDEHYDVKTDRELLAFKNVLHYFTEDFPGLSDRTRSVIEHSFWGLLFRLIREPVQSLLCSTQPNISPEDSLQGKIILIHLPIKMYDKVGRDAQILFKYIWQRAMERRLPSADMTPVFLWADEAQNFIHEHDIDYQATARSSRVCTVYLTQNIPNYYAHMGGRNSEFRVKSFLGTMGTKIFHANADMDTNTYAAELIGKSSQWKANESAQYVGSFSMSEGRSEDRDFIIQPEDFTLMRTGGAINNYLVDARIHRQGLPWFSSARSDRKISFQQRQQQPL